VDVIKSKKKSIANTMNYVENLKRGKITEREREVSLCQWRLQWDSLDLGECGPFHVGRDLLFIQVMSNR